MRDRHANTHLASSFGKAAEVYEASRPSYPAEAVEWLLGDSAHEVLDLGAGTGKLTRVIAASGRAVHAVDPSPEMLDVLNAKLSESGIDVAAQVGSAEAIPLPDDAVDAVTVAQAWHWFDTGRAVPEIARVLRPGGTLGLVWNGRDNRVDWVRELDEAMHADDALDVVAGDGDRPPVVGEPFGPIERAVFEWSQPLTHEGMLDLVRSRSYFIVRTPDEQAETLAAVEDVLARIPGVSSDGIVSMPYVTFAFRTRL